MKRSQKQFQKTKILIARLNYNPESPPEDLKLELPGWLYKVSKIYYFTKEIEKVKEPIPRIRARIIESDSLLPFGCVSHSPDRVNDVLNLKNIPFNFVMIIDIKYREDIMKSICELDSLFFIPS